MCRWHIAPTEAERRKIGKDKVRSSSLVMASSKTDCEYPLNTKRKKGSRQMRLEKIQDYLKEKQWKYEYTEEDGLGSIDFEHRGLSYHIWEFEDNGYGAETNVRTVGRQEDITGDYEKEIIEILKTW